MFIGVEELQHATASGHYAAMSTALDKADLSQWKEKVVGLGSDGAAVMVGRLGGVTTLLRAEVPHLINIQCLAHGLELAAMDAMKDHERMRKASNREVISQPSNRSASAEMIGRAKQCLQVLKDFQHLLFIVLVQDVMEVFSCLSLKLQEDGLTLPEALYAFETAVLRLTAMETEAGECVEGFLAETQNGTFHNEELLRFRESRKKLFAYTWTQF
ncbi:hypothetical protein SKAU_G00413400 [Synaphobranchus kaupii]|uniref:Uncharacterized protein n=1 Tax=Synaphobranchus kaupii TaxID=118154 RepID=A0A9Q1IBZ4_SYNKA|nr:hypothetical protein SKAU_G00413400 [Synaphobranchus kaupii]